MLPIGPTSEGFEIEGFRFCGKCKAVHTHVPKDAPFKSGLYWWDCSCKSTLTATEAMLLNYQEKLKKNQQKEKIVSEVSEKQNAVVIDKNNVSHIIYLPCWTSDYRTIQIMLNKKPTTIEFVKTTKSVAYFKEKVANGNRK